MPNDIRLLDSRDVNSQVRERFQEGSYRLGYISYTYGIRHRKSSLKRAKSMVTIDTRATAKNARVTLARVVHLRVAATLRAFHVSSQSSSSSWSALGNFVVVKTQIVIT